MKGLPVDAVLEIEFPVIAKGKVQKDEIEYARIKISKTLLHSSATVTHAAVRLTREADPARDRPAIAEATLSMKGRVIRAHVGAASMNEAIDLLDARLRRRIEDGNDRRRSLSMRHRDDGPGEWRHGAVPSERPARFERDIDERELVRHKSFAVAHQTIDEAAFDLEALDHDFFLFRDERSDSDAVIWRFEGHYGLIEVDPNASPTPDTVADVEPMAIPVPTIDVEAAIEHLDVEGGPFVFFLNTETGRGNVVYFRYDGHYGLIEPAE